MRYLILVALLLAGCASSPEVGEKLERRGEEIVVAGQLFHVGAPVVLWTDPGGYDAYRTERRFSDWDEASWEATAATGEGPSEPQRYNTRFAKPTSTDPLTPEEIELVRGGGWTLPMLRERVDQFVLHYDVCGISARCFDVLHDRRGLSVHFMLDLDGTIYQTMDVKERAWHAAKANDRSVGIEIANMGAYPPPPPTADDEPLLPEWYEPDGTITLPQSVRERYGEDGSLRVPGTYRSARSAPVHGEIHDTPLRQWDVTPEQYASLTKLTRALNAALPRIELRYPAGEDGEVLTRELTDDEFAEFSGVLGHWHVTTNKIDPGPALDWDRVLGE